MPRMSSGAHGDLLRDVLRDVSRSFHLTLRVLPGSIRTPISLAYLLARAADSIADTAALDPTQRLDRLLEFRNLVTGHARAPADELVQAVAAASGPGAASPAEMVLLRRLPECLELLRGLDAPDRVRVGEVVAQLTVGMELDLRRFPSDGVVRALGTFDDLEDYTYHVAGCVGPFWTRMCVAHIPSFREWDVEGMCELGIRFGKALQWTNVLRDLPRDLQNGRCYLPLQELTPLGIKPAELGDPSSYARVRPLYQRCLDHALGHYRAAWRYTMAIPRSCVRVRLACVIPIWIGLETLALLRRAPNPLDPSQRIRITRGRVKRIVIAGALRVWSNDWLDDHHQRLARAVTGS